MPSKTFLNLPIEKKEKLMKASLIEFSTAEFMDISINKIIQNAGISRGSFYMYFESKEDLFEYILVSYHEKIKKIIKQELKENSGDLRNTFLNLYDVVLDKVMKVEYKMLFKNVFTFFHLKKDCFINPGHELYLEIKDDILRENIKDEDLEFIVNLFIHTLFSSITDTLRGNHPELEHDKYNKKIDILCYGVYK